MGETPYDTDVLIVGAGPTGLTMAYDLARRGVACRIIDRAPSPSVQSRALAIHARTLETFRHLGIASPFLERGHRVIGARMYANGKQIAHVDMAEIDSQYPFILTLPQAETELILTQALTRLNVTVERPVEFISLKDIDNTIEVVLRRDGVDTRLRSRWLVGCDGAHSTVRHELGISFAGAAYADPFVLADVRVDWERRDDEAHVFLAPTGLAAFFPLGSRRWRLIVGLRAGDEGDGEPTLDECQEYVDTFVSQGEITTDEPPQRAATLLSPLWMTRFRIHRRIADNMRSGRVFLAGDAAGIHSPAGGQGMNTGIQSAFNLSWKLALVTQGMSPESLLDTYHSERHPVELQVLRSTDMLMRAVSMVHPAAQWSRNAVISSLTRLGFVQHRITSAISEIAVSYGTSLAAKEYSVRGGVSAGERAPDGEVTDAPIMDKRRVHELLDPLLYTLLLLTGRGAHHAPDQALQRLIDITKTAIAQYRDRITVAIISSHSVEAKNIISGVRVWLDADGAVTDRYSKQGPSLYLIRPDGYVGFRCGSTDADRLLDTLQNLFIESRPGAPQSAGEKVDD